MISNRTWSSPLIIPSLVAFFTGVGTLARAILPGVRIVGDMMKTTAGFAAKLNSHLEQEIKEVAQADLALQRTAAEADARRAAAERANRALARYIDPNSTVANPPRLLRFLLEDDPNTRSLEKEIGLISRVRRLFQAVDNIVQEERRKNRSGHQNDILKSDVPQRIVIYIDDLDRCTPEQVYAVLQAIHLLLAFKLFVVVVAVDVSWVQEALVREFSSNGVAARDLSADENRLKEQRLAVRYLEKIFQLPFWLRRLSSEGDRGGTYGRFVRTLLPEVESNSSDPSDEQSTSDSSGKMQAPTATDRQEDSVPGSADRGSEASFDAQSHQIDDDYLSEVLVTVTLTKEEIDFLAGEAIGSLASREPRTVKRFINIYRIIRGRLRDAEKARFLGTGGRPPEYPIVAVLIAIETGQDLQVADALFHRVTAPDESESIGSDIGAAIREGFEAARKARGGVVVTRSDCARWAGTVRRYSFNKNF